jgi:hypothetical protein
MSSMFCIFKKNGNMHETVCMVISKPTDIFNVGKIYTNGVYIRHSMNISGLYTKNKDDMGFVWTN